MPVRALHVGQEWDDALFIAGELCSDISSDNRILLYTTRWGIFSSRQDIAIYMAFCRDSGLDPDIVRFPGAEYWLHERRVLQSHLAIAILFMWDIVLSPDLPTSMIEISHDGQLDIYGSGIEWQYKNILVKYAQP